MSFIGILIIFMITSCLGKKVRFSYVGDCTCDVYVALHKVWVESYSFTMERVGR